ncbi:MULTISPECIES: hypothetical protein [Streptomyces]|uniref:DUF3592 domain-containing protein n=2 Tax=Streptomyces TaxID=1883 RepID=A0ABU4K897_9ACTN|nr:hypothetical protein [Streptomyces roseolus]MDX2293969.1 hypothetical protein [Streptomyces roseolus]
MVGLEKAGARTRPTYRRSGWTTFTGWAALLSAAGAVGCALWGVSPYPPLGVEAGAAALAVVFAGAWIVASRRAPEHVGLAPVGGRGPAWVVAWLVPLATLACFDLGFMVSPEYGRETERLEAAGYGRYSVTVVRLAGDPVRGDNASDEPVFFHTDLVLSLPYADGPREVTVPGMYTRYEPPTAGSRIDVYFAPRDPRPDSPVLEDGRRWGVGVIGTRLLIVTLMPVVFAGALLTGVLRYEMPRGIRRFSPAVHLPALGILLLGLLLLLPTVLGWDVTSVPVRVAAFLSCVTPGAALAWAWRSA